MGRRKQSAQWDLIKAGVIFVGLLLWCLSSQGLLVALLQLIFWGIIAALLVAVIVFALKQLDNPGQPGVAAIVQCKAWQTYNVGVKPVRELFGVMAADRVPEGFFVTTGDYTGDARTLTRQGRLRCVGPDKGGHWEVGKARFR